MPTEPTLIAIVPTPEWREALLGEGPCRGYPPRILHLVQRHRRVWVDREEGEEWLVEVCDWCGEPWPCLDAHAVAIDEWKAPTPCIWPIPDGDALPLLWEGRPVPDGIARAVRAVRTSCSVDSLEEIGWLVLKCLRKGIAAEIVTDA